VWASILVAFITWQGANAQGRPTIDGGPITKLFLRKVVPLFSVFFSWFYFLSEAWAYVDTEILTPANTWLWTHVLPSGQYSTVSGAISLLSQSFFLRNVTLFSVFFQLVLFSFAKTCLL
jgi:hypothetical protein